MSEQAWYRDWFNSPFYHKLYFERDGNEAAAFINQLICHLNPESGSYILDVACGRGRHSRILAEMGYRVTGIDLAHDSIAFAKKFETDNLEFFQHDMRLPFQVNYFDYVFNFFTSFGYFKTRREHGDAIRTIALALKTNGIFVMDYVNVHYAEDHLLPHEIKMVKGTNYEVQRWQDESHFYKRITIQDPSLNSPEMFTEKVAKFSLEDFSEMLSYFGLPITEIFGDYQLGKYDLRNKPRLIIIAKKIAVKVKNQ